MNPKIKLSFALFVVSFSFFSGSTLIADAVPFCHAKGGSGGYTLLDTSDPGFDNGHGNHPNDLSGDQCVSAYCGEGFEIVNNQCTPICIGDQTLVDGMCVDPQCIGDQTLVDGMCVDPQCIGDQTLVDGMCVEVPLECDPGFVLVDNQCVRICSSRQSMC